MTAWPARFGKMCKALFLASVPPTMLALGNFLMCVLGPVDGVFEPGLLIAAQIVTGLTFVSVSALCVWAWIDFVQPWRRVALRARALADGDVTSPVPHRGRDDEIDWVADSILATASTMRELEASRHMLRELNRTLEERVAERTAELTCSNRRLEQALADIGAVQRELVRHERLASLGSMVAGFAHELNTPIGNALTSASVLAREVRTLKAANVSDPATVAERLQRVSELLERSLGRAAELITTFKQVSVDQASAHRRSFQLHDAVRALHDTVSPRLRRTSVQLRLTVPADIHLDSYPGPLEQALYNLVNNAVVHAFEGRSAGTIEIRAEQEAGLVRIAVEDDGIGIPAEVQPFVFDPFFTTKMGQGGTGLGLHMVYTTVTALLGGRVMLDSALGHGTRVVLEIPAVAPAARAA